MNRKFMLVLTALTVAPLALASVKVTSLNLKTNGPNGYVNISFEGRTNDLPDMKVTGKIIEVTLPGSEAFDAISKNIRGAQLSANMLNGKAVIKAILPYAVPADAVNLNWNNNNIEVVFPRGHVAEGNPVAANTMDVPTKLIKEPTATKPATVPEKKEENKISKELLNEDYLNQLVKDNNAATAAETKLAQTAQKAPVILKNELKKDEIKTKQASVAAVPLATKSSDNFSFAGYVAKFGVFLALVLGLFYGVVQLLKKGVFNRGKLGFLNNTQMIQVLSTTYVSPKRSLMIVKAHKQVFLVANSESGLEFLSEMKDTSGLIKEGEKFVTGTNFDMNLGSAENNEESESSQIKLKENILESSSLAEEKGLGKLAVAKDIVKFSDELKKKAKKLKPIEFN